MIIDFHTHSFPDQSAEKTIKILEAKGGSKAFTDGTRLGLVNSMKAAGIDCSIVLPVLTKPEQFKSINYLQSSQMKNMMAVMVSN